MWRRTNGRDFDNLEHKEWKSVQITHTEFDRPVTNNEYVTVLPFIDKPLIKVITGMRRTGKSTIMKLLIEHLCQSGVDRQCIMMVNMESIDNAPLQDVHVFQKAVREKKRSAPGKIYLFIDEVQEIPGWERLAASLLADGDADIYSTGSNSRLLSGEYATLLTGRFVSFQVCPLVYAEFLAFKELEHGSPEAFNEFLLFGGMPGIHHIEYTQEFVYQYLSAVKDSIILKDIVARYKIRDVQLMEKLLVFLADNIGNIFSARRVADYFKKEQRSLGIETIYNYLAYLESAFVFNKVQRFDIKGRQLLETNEKYFVTDIGLRHSIIGFRQKDINAYLENIVYIELLSRGYKLMIGKAGKYEVDFIAEKNNERIYVQVCYLLADESTMEREYRPLKMISDNYPKFVVSMDMLPEADMDGILRVYLPDFLLRVL